MPKQKPITFEEAKELKVGTILYHTKHRNRDGSAQKWKVNGKVKTWKRNPDKIQIPVKHGMYSFGYIYQDDLHLVSLEDCK